MRASRKAVADFFDTLCMQYVEPAEGRRIDYTVSEPKHLFLDYLVKKKRVVLHGSNRLDLTALRPNAATGLYTDQALTAVYATTDSFMAIFFAIIDRPYVRRFSTRSAPYQFFVDEASFVNRPWISGAVYILQREQFEATPSGNLISYEDAPVIATLHVTPSDFPFLDQVQGY